MDSLRNITESIILGERISREKALSLVDAPLEELCSFADTLRKHFCGDRFDMCTIINGKCGRCSEDCKYCAQSASYRTDIDEHPLLSTDEIVENAKKNASQGVLRFSIVTSGKRLTADELDRVCESIRAVREQVGINVCASFGLLGENDFRKVRAAGASRYHCNLETSERFFPSVCTTHTFAEKVTALKAAKRAGLSICSGGIMGLGETMTDRIDMALALRELDVKSVPINFLNPIKGTPFEHNMPLSNDEKRRIIAIFRFILPDAFIRLAGGRGLIADKGEGCFRSGANAAISGDMLTTSGITVRSDNELLARLGYTVKL